MPTWYVCNCLKISDNTIFPKDKVNHSKLLEVNTVKTTLLFLNSSFEFTSVNRFNDTCSSLLTVEARCPYVPPHTIELDYFYKMQSMSKKYSHY